MDGTDSLFYYYPLPKKKPPVSPSPCPSDHQIPTTTTNANTDTITTKTTTNATINNNNNKNSFPFYKPIDIKERDFLFNYNPFHKHKAAPTSSSLDSPPANTKTTKKMDSHVLLEAFTCRDTLIMILRKLGARDLARASCVCKMWRDMASGDEIVRPAFMEPWKLKDIVGKPVSGSFWRDSGIWKFAISHKIVKGDSVASLAVKYSVQVMDIKRINNMTSDHGIYSRERLLIPIINPNLLINETCYIELDTYAKREVAVLYPEGKPDKKLMSKGSSSDHGKRRVIDSLKRSMQVDDGTAQYYWSISNGDPRAALTEFSADLRWERNAGLG
ncbi:F-box protein At1g55000 [Populus alba]|uniref:F-box protein n=2 Tax=Populus TaxID=3689 RepID=A0A4U5Q3Y9_POPAL|nr:F-box protein At1g55000-like [Populus alba]TKS04341.1 F-box protein [Populus alba]